MKARDGREETEIMSHRQKARERERRESGVGEREGGWGGGERLSERESGGGWGGGGGDDCVTYRKLERD